MRTLIRFAILMSAIICADSFAGPQSAFAQEKIYWQTNPQQAAHQAAQENKLVLLHFTAEWCGPCQTQKRFVFSNPGVARAVNQSVIPVLVDIDVNRELAGELGVKSVPFDVFLTPGGEVVSKRRSPSDSHNFIKMVSSTRTVGTAPKSGALAKLAQLKRKFDPMSLPNDQRADFGVDAPEPATLGVSKEAMGLGARSNYGDQMTFQKRKSTGSAKDGVNSDLQSVFGSIDQRKKMQGFDRDPRSEQSNPFFEIPEERSEQSRLANVPAASKMVSNPMTPQPGQRSYENMQRQEFLARERADIEFPSQPTDVQPVRVMNENFLAAAKSEFGSNSLKPSSILPGLAVSDMVDARTGRSIVPARNSGRSIARFKPNNPEPLPSNEFRIVPHKENRIAGHAVDNSFASQATLKRETPASMAELSVSGTASAEPNSVANNQMAAESNTLDSQTDAGESDFCLEGKCPVALALEGKWVDGDTRWGIVHRDRTYLFSSEENYRRFQQQPDHYSPVLAAYDPVAFHDSGKFVDGLEKNGVFMEKDEHQQIVLFSTEENREKFQTNPHLYMRSVRKAIFTASRVDVPGSVADTNFR